MNISLSQAVAEATEILNNRSDILHKKRDFLEKRIELLENRKKRVENSKRIYSFEYNKRANRLIYKIGKRLAEKTLQLHKIQEEIDQVGLGKTYLYCIY